MIVDRKWAKGNLSFDPIATPQATKSVVARP